MNRNNKYIVINSDKRNNVPTRIKKSIKDQKGRKGPGYKSNDGTHTKLQIMVPGNPN